MKTQNYLISSLVILVVLAASCSGKNDEREDAIALSVAATQTKQAWDAEIASIRLTEEATIPEKTPTPEPVSHVIFPGEPPEFNNTYVTDFNSIDFAQDGFTYGDQYLINRYERPFTVEMEKYHGYLDIILANMKVNPPWIYVDVYFADILPEVVNAKYALEFDVDEDGRGDYLVQALLPGPGAWTTEGVKIFEDQDNDVGGSVPHLPDSDDGATTGYEFLLFEGGLGSDPDLAWIRRNPEENSSLQFAIKIDLLGNNGFLWSVWADEGLMDPALQEYNDIYKFEEAGSPYPEHEFYPIQAINMVDSTCISWYAYEPVGDEIGLCQVYYKDGPAQGWKLCYDFRDNKVCSDECMKTCPPNISAPWSCERCKLPSEE